MSRGLGLLPHLSLPWAAEQGGGCGQFVRDVSRAGAPGSRSALGACLAYGVLGCGNCVPRGGKNKNYLGLDMQIDVYRKHLIDLLGSFSSLGADLLCPEGDLTLLESVASASDDSQLEKIISTSKS